MREIPLDPTVRRFFVAFSRLEYALKRAGYVKTRGRNIAAEVDWSRFAKGKADRFDAMIQDDRNPTLPAAVQFIRDDPPSKLVLLDKGNTRDLFWKKAGPKGVDLDGLLVLVRRIRNNLFHGEKPETSVGGNQRGIELVKSAQQIVNACVELDHKVRRYYEEYSTPIPRLD